MTIVDLHPAIALRGRALPASLRREMPIGALEHDGYFVLRTPLLPISAWQENRETPRANRDEASEGYIRHRDDALKRLWDLLQRDDVREALFIASPSLHERLQSWDGTIANESSHKLALSLARYAGRLCTRSTPFGLFAGVSTGSITSQPSLLHGDLADASALRRHTRLDTVVVHAIADGIGKRPDLKSALRYSSNASGHRLGERWRYVDWETAGTARRYKLSAVDFNPYLDRVLKFASIAARSFDELCAELRMLDGEIESADAGEFIDELIAARLLVADLEPTLSGEEPLPSLLRSMAALSGASASASVLVEVNARLLALDAGAASNDVIAYRKIEELLRDLCPEIDRKQLFQVDLYKELTELRLNESVVTTILEAARVYMAIGAQRNTSLDGFCQRFAERYKEKRVPLLLALDDDAGIGSGRVTSAPDGLLKDIGLGAESARPSIVWSAFDALLLERCMVAARANVDCVELGDEDIALLLPKKTIKAAGSLSMMLTLAAADSAALDRGEFRLHIHSLGGPGAGNLLGRFCFGSKQLSANLAHSLRQEEAADTDAIFAEIIHLPQERIGNVICRPLLRDYEIACHGRSGAAAGRQIQLSDIDIEVRGQEIALWSRRLRKRIVPRLTTAHNFSADNLGIYQFLCQLQYYGTSGFQLAWGTPFQHLRRLPRVFYRNIVLLPARWRVLAKECRELTGSKAAERFVAAQSLRRKLDMPRYVGIREGDNVLSLDFLNPLAVDNLADMLSTRGELLLTELACVPGQLCVEGEQGGYAHEIVLPIRHLPKTEESGSRRKVASPSYARAPMVADAPSVAHAERSATPGGAWLFVKLYCGVAAVDDVLLDALAPLLADWRQAGLIDSWFFLRYADPGWHLRL
ncbi:MAG TPA: lantibiotic dehydratase, partial [Xanthomonadaceae bacterium]|nr:lantibiotic dehydratase [Xanthomonadaceae bacterium]